MVVGIIAVLIAILLPSLSKAKEQARRAVCLSNVRHMGLATQFYVAEYKHIFPYVGTENAQGQNPYSWTQLLMNGGRSNGSATAVQTGGYGVNERMNVCPDAATINSVGTAGVGNFGTAITQWGNSVETGPGVTSSYGINGWIYNAMPDGTEGGIITTGEGLPSGGGGYVYGVPPQSGDSLIPVFADCNWRHVFPKTNDPAPTSTQDPNLISTVFHPIGRLMLNRHNFAINVSFYDGHGETVKLRDLYSLNWSLNWVPPATIPVIPTK